MEPLPLFFYALSLTVSAIMATYLLRHLLFTFWAIAHRKPRNHKRALKWSPKVTILIPAHNEEKVIGQLLKSLTGLSYKGSYDVVVVDDASKDRTGEIAEQIAAATQSPYISVIHRAHGGNGKPLALNEALGHATGEILIFFDADYLPRKDLIQQLLRGFTRPDVAAVQGYIEVRNHSRALISKVVRLERLAGYRISQHARGELRLMPQLGGTVMAVRRKALQELSGFNTEALAEDTDLTLRLTLRGYRVHYGLEARSSEEAVEGMRAYFRQRHRWALGHMQCALRYSGKILRSKLSRRVKADALLCLGVYFVPPLVGLSWILSGLAVILGFPMPTYTLSLSALSIFSAVGNFAPIFEIIAGAILDRAHRALMWLPLIPVVYVVNVIISAKALTDLALKRTYRWVHTEHNGAETRRRKWRQRIHKGSKPHPFSLIGSHDALSEKKP
ncbi:glycosyltransferase family 2 protein [Candidatus Bathyarchaeota archaeon A05DMB-2]|jgi:cellulose synthase/poly-beta-1,6-N-acetylglucosamine synthase-like glycosyltransferase|nr:glycosyltransferase family 2 protein [Candidatus Bathyarchaeota archaeon A05DMB-2]